MDGNSDANLDDIGGMSDGSGAGDGDLACPNLDNVDSGDDFDHVVVDESLGEDYVNLASLHNKFAKHVGDRVLVGEGQSDLLRNTHANTVTLESIGQVGFQRTRPTSSTIPGIGAGFHASAQTLIWQCLETCRDRGLTEMEHKVHSGEAKWAVVQRCADETTMGVQLSKEQHAKLIGWHMDHLHLDSYLGEADKERLKEAMASPTAHGFCHIQVQSASVCMKVAESIISREPVLRPLPIQSTSAACVAASLSLACMALSFEHLKDSWASFLQFLFLFLILDSASGNDRVTREYLRDCKDVHFLNVLLSDFGNTIYIYIYIY